jgi:hypothetical protein
MTINSVVPAGDSCAWEVNEGDLLTGRMDLLSLAAPGGAIGHSRRYPIGVNWVRLSASSEEDESETVNNSFVTLRDAEVRLIYSDRVVVEPTEQTQQNLPATYVVPTMGTEGFDKTPPAVFDLIPTWVAERLALDANIWASTTDSGRPASGKDYLLTTEFRLRGLTAGGDQVVSNWFRWVIHLCRGCQLQFTATPPMRPAEGVPVFPGHYTSADLARLEPLPAVPGIISWCAAGVSQGKYQRDLVQPSQPLQPKVYQ